MGIEQQDFNYYQNHAISIIRAIINTKVKIKKTRRRDSWGVARGVLWGVVWECSSGCTLGV